MALVSFLFLCTKTKSFALYPDAKSDQEPQFWLTSNFLDTGVHCYERGRKVGVIFSPLGYLPILWDCLFLVRQLLLLCHSLQCS